MIKTFLKLDNYKFLIHITCKLVRILVNIRYNIEQHTQLVYPAMLMRYERGLFTGSTENILN